MIRRFMRTSAWCAASAFGLFAPADASADGIDFIVSQDAEGRLVVSRPDSVEEPYRILPGSVDGLPGYYLTIEPGWDGRGVDDPDSGLRALTEGATIALRRVAFDAGFEMFNIDFEPILQAEDDLETLEGEAEADEFIWHEHLVFGVVAGEPVGKEFSATFTLTDLSSQHADSEEFTLRFVTARTPTVVGGGSRSGACGLGLMPLVIGALGFIGLARRHRSTAPR